MSGRHRARLGSGWVHLTVGGVSYPVALTRRLLRRRRALVTLLAELHASTAATTRRRRALHGVVVRAR